MIQENSKEFRVPNIPEAVEKLKLPGYFLYTSEAAFRAWGKNRLGNMNDIELRYIRDPNFVDSSFLLAKDCPYTKIINIGISQLKVHLLLLENKRQCNLIKF